MYFGIPPGSPKAESTQNWRVKRESWDPLRVRFFKFSVIWGSKMGDSFQVHVFGDPGMEMMPECSGCMCLNHIKSGGF